MLGFGLSARALLIAGVLWAIPAFFHPHRIWMMLAWDGLIVLDGVRLPAPSAITLTRRCFHSPALGGRPEIESQAVQRSNVQRISSTYGLEWESVSS